MTDTDRLKAEILSLFREEVKDLWDREDAEFLSGLAEDVARENLLAATSPEPRKHQENLRFLAATLQSRVTQKNLNLNRKGEALFVRILAVAIRAVALAVLKV